MAQRYCTNCSAELPEDARFCGGCGRPAHQIAAVPTPEADVPVAALEADAPAVPPPASQGGAGPESGPFKNFARDFRGSLRGSARGLRGMREESAARDRARAEAFADRNRARAEAAARTPGPQPDGRILLVLGEDAPVPEVERSRRLEAEILRYARDGYQIRHSTAFAVQLVRPKTFSGFWALFWFLFFGVGVVVYLIHYAAKRDGGRYVEADEYGAVRATPQDL